MQIYPTNLTDSQWAKIENLFDSRKRKYLLRAIINALFYSTESGIQWRMLSKEYPKWQLIVSKIKFKQPLSDNLAYFE